MSFILDALRRADAERERGSVPTLHSQSAPHDTAAAAAAQARRRAPGLWVAGLGVAAVALLLLAALVSQWTARDGSEPAQRLEPPVLQAQGPAPMQAPVQAPVAGPMMTPAPLAPAREAAGLASAEPKRAAPAPLVRPAPTLPPAPVPAMPVVAEANMRAKPALGQQAAPGLSELPEALRRELPALATSGAMYSDTPANRMIIINGQVFHEGDKVGANLVLEEIKLRAAILSFKGQRFALSY
jgi:general secretion pathway protein B